MKKLIGVLLSAFFVGPGSSYAVGNEFSQKSIVEMISGGHARQAFNYTEGLAEQGDVDAQMAMVWFYVRGIGVKADPKKKIYWLEKVAEQGDTRGHHELAVTYLDGRGVVPDIKKAIYWYERAYNDGSTFRAPEDLAKIYLSNVGVPRSVDLAKLWISRCVVPKYHAADSCVREVEKFLSYAADRKTDPKSIDPLRVVGSVELLDGDNIQVLRFGLKDSPLEYYFHDLDGPWVQLYELRSLRRVGDYWSLESVGGKKYERFWPRLGVGSKLLYSKGSDVIALVAIDESGRVMERQVQFSDVQSVVIDPDAYFVKQGWWGAYSLNDEN